MFNKTAISILFIALGIFSLFSQTSYASHCNVDPPTLNGPLDSSTVNSLTPALSISPNINRQAGTCLFRQTLFQISTDPTFQSNLVYDSQGPWLAVDIPSGILLADQTYYWRVSVEIRELELGDDVNIIAGPFFEIWSFKTPFLFTPIEAPQCNWSGIAMHYPEEGEFVTEVRPKFEIAKSLFVQAPACEHNETIWEIYEDANMQTRHSRFASTTNLIEFNLNASLLPELNPGNMYYWRVKFGGPDGIESDWFGLYSFSVLNSQQIPLLGDNPIPGPDPQLGGGPGSFDQNDNCTLEDSEFFVAVDQWIAQLISDIIFFQVVDAWIGQLDICVQFQGISNPVHLKISARGILFEAQNYTAPIAIDIFDTSGHKIKRIDSAQSKLVWNLQDSTGREVANGVYFYVATMQSLDGNLAMSGMKKLAVMR